jgi:NADH:ubiquinone reductase (non-electrogenic)
MAKLPDNQTNKRGISVDGTLRSVSTGLQCSPTPDHLRMLGAPSIFALGDCTSTSYAPTAQVAFQQGAYLARIFKLIAKRDALEDQVRAAKDGEQLDETTKRVEKLTKKIGKIRLNPFHYSHQGSLA